MAVTHRRYKFVTVSLPKRFRNGRFASETAAEVQPPPGSRSTKKNPLELLESSLDVIVFQGGDDGRGYRNMYKIPRGSPLNERD
jgi:hypothetical protein